MGRSRLTVALGKHYVYLFPVCVNDVELSQLREKYLHHGNQQALQIRVICTYTCMHTQIPKCWQLTFSSISMLGTKRVFGKHQYLNYKWWERAVTMQDSFYLLFKASISNTYLWAYNISNSVCLSQHPKD